MSLRALVAIVVCHAISVAAVADEKIDTLYLQQKADKAFQQYLSAPDASIDEARQLLDAAIHQRSTYFQGYAYYLMAKCHWAKGNFGTSTESAFHALRRLEHSPYDELTGEVMLVLARTLIELRNFSQADQFLDRADALSEKTGSRVLKAGVYRERSMVQMERKDYAGSIRTADLGLAIYEAVGDTLNSSVLYGRKARAYCALEDFEQSTFFNDKAMQLDGLIDNKRGLGILYYQAAVNAYKLNKLDESNALLAKAFTLVNEIGGLGTLIKAHHLQALIYAQQKRLDAAVAEFKLAGVLKDSLYNTERNSKFQEMQSLYELQQKDAAILALEQSKERQKLITVGLMVGMVLLLMPIFILWRMRIIQKRANATLTSRNLAIEQQKEEMQAQAENLLELNQLKSKLFSVISHDLRGPISNLHALLSLLTTKSMTAEEFINISLKLKANLNVTQRTLENLLNWSLSQMDGLRTEARTFDVRGVIEDVCHLMNEMAERKHLTFEISGALPTAVRADLNQIQLILRNLIHNAVKFSRQNSIIRVSTVSEGNHCCVRVEDFGIGMTPEERGMVGDHPHHFTKVGTLEEKGTGLGLLLCKEFVKRNGGELVIHSTPGQGTTVSFTVPLAAEVSLLIPLEG